MKHLQFPIILLFVSLFAGLTSFAKDTSLNFTIVENKKVCMVNDTHFGRDQIAVAVGGKTYYGCCENCKKTLAENSSSREAVDPQSKRKVDKATAFIVAKEDQSVLYFENKKNFDLYLKEKKK